MRVHASPTNLASADFAVTFSQSVAGVDATDFGLTTTGVSGASVAGVSGSGATYTVTVNTGSGSGSIRLDVLDDDSIADSAGNPLGGSGPTNGNFSTGELYTIDKTAPTAGSLAAANVTIGGGTTYSFTVSFSDNLAIDITSPDGSDIRVTGPGGFNQLAWPEFGTVVDRLFRRADVTALQIDATTLWPDGSRGRSSATPS